MADFQPPEGLREIVAQALRDAGMVSTGLWRMNIGGVTVHVKADRDGHPLRVSVAGPLDYDEPVRGCEYELTWTDPPADPPVREETSSG